MLTWLSSKKCTCAVMTMGQMRHSSEMWNSNKTIHLPLCVWKFANLPPSIKQQRYRKSVQLFIFFHLVPSQETVSAANGEQQRLDSPWAEQTHMWCDLWLTSANPLQILLSFLFHSNDPALYTHHSASLKAKYHSITPVDGSHESFTDATVYAWTAELHRNVLVYARVYSWKWLGVYVPLCMCKFVSAYMLMWFFFIF